MNKGRITFWNQNIDVVVGRTGEKCTLNGCEFAIEGTHIGAVHTFTSVEDELNKRYALVFNISGGHMPYDVIAHEVWHLYFFLMSHVAPEVDYMAEELMKEAYAYQFGELYEKVHDEFKKLTEGKRNARRSKTEKTGKRPEKKA